MTIHANVHTAGGKYTVIIKTTYQMSLAHPVPFKNEPDTIFTLCSRLLLIIVVDLGQRFRGVVSPPSLLDGKKVLKNLRALFCSLPPCPGFLR